MTEPEDRAHLLGERCRYCDEPMYTIVRGHHHTEAGRDVTEHYPDCACDEPDPETGDDWPSLTCAKRYAVELAVHTEDDARARFVCSAESMEHWPESVERAEDGDWLVTCGACGAETWVRGSAPDDSGSEDGPAIGGDDPGYRSAMRDAGRGALLP